MLIEGTLLDMIKSVEKEITSSHLKNRSLLSRISLHGKKDDFNAFCTPSKLDGNIEEGLVMGQRVVLDGLKSMFLLFQRSPIMPFVVLIIQQEHYSGLFHIVL